MKAGIIPRQIAAIVLAAFFLCAAGAGFAAEYNPIRTAPSGDADSIQRVIVKMRTSGAAAGSRAANKASATGAPADQPVRLANRIGLTLHGERQLTARMHALQVIATAGESRAQVLARMRADPDVEYAVEDRRVHAFALSGDPLGPGGGGQWYLQGTQPSGIDAVTAWDTTVGSDAVVIAVVDTGVRFEHPDLGRAGSGDGRLLPGYDFVSANSAGNFSTANDGDGRDADASDPGDWITTADRCGDAQGSSWHGTRSSGIIGAISNNGIGISGVTWKGRILPVRVLGKCGGFNSDVLAGMLWAAGLTVSGVPANPNPARIVNLSLGSEGTCDQASRDVVNQLTTLGVLVVVSAGNSGGPVNSPANCPGAMGIAGLRHAGTKVGYSSLGPEIALSAPAGNCVNVTAGSACLYSIDTTVNAGTTTPASSAYTDQFNANLGTSFSAPIVSGIAGLMLGVNSRLKATQLTARLKEGARVFPTASENANVPSCRTPASWTDLQATECICTTSVCGAGMAHAPGAVSAALRPIADIVVQGSVGTGAQLTLQGTGSLAADGRVLTSYEWLKGGALVGTSPTSSIAVPASGTSTACLRVTDDTGRQDTARVDVTPAAATVSIVAAGQNPCNVPEITVSATDPTASESGDTATLTLVRTGDPSAPLSVAITLSGTAGSGVDYQAVGNSITFAAGSATAAVTIVPIDDAIADGAKSLTVTIAQGSGYTVGAAASATISILDNDTTALASGADQERGGGGALDVCFLGGLLLLLLRVGCPAAWRRLWAFAQW